MLLSMWPDVCLVVTESSNSLLVQGLYPVHNRVFRVFLFVLIVGRKSNLYQ